MTPPNLPLETPPAEGAQSPEVSMRLLPGGMGQPPPNQEPEGGVFDLLDALGENPPPPEGVDALIDETDRIEAKLRDDPMPRPAVLDLTDADLKEVFRERLTEASGFKQGFIEDMALRAWDAYHLKIDPSIDKWKSKFTLPYIRSLVSSSIPSSLAAAFGGGTILRIKPRQPEFQKRAEAMEQLIQKQLTSRKVKARRVFADFLWYRALLGTGILSMGWRYEQRLMPVSVPVYDDPDPEETMAAVMAGEPPPKGQFLGKRRALKSVVTHDEIEFRCVDFWNAFPCPWTRLDTVPYMIERVESTREEAMAEAKSGAWGEEAETLDDGTTSTPEEALALWFEENPTFNMLDDSCEAGIGDRATMMQRIGMRSPYQDSGMSSQVDEGPKPCIYYRYSTRDVRIVFAGDGSRRILGKQMNPYDQVDLPYVFSQYERTPGIVWGMGIGMVAGPVQRLMDFDINHTIDGRRLALNPVLKRRRVGGAIMGDVTLKPGSFIDVREMDDLEPLELKDPTSQGILFNQFLMGLGDKATGIGDLQRGVSDGGVDTATEASIQDSNAITRKLTHVFEIRDTWEEVGHIAIALNKQFYDKTTMIRTTGVAGLDWQEVTPEDTIGEFDVEPNASLTRSDISLRRRDMLQALTIFNGDPLTNQHELRRRFWTAMDEERIDDILQPLPPPPQDPMDEEIALGFGYAVPVSPEEDFAGHIQVHQMALEALMAAQVKDSRAIVAHQRHLQETMQMMALARQQMTMAAAAGAPAGPGQEGAGGAPEAGKVRDGATRLGQGQGSNGTNGEAPGPSAPPGRPVRDLP